MNWRTDKPTEDIIVGQLSSDFCGDKERYAILYLATKPYEHYYENGEEVPYSAIIRWASLKKEETPIERELAEAYLAIFDKKFGDKIPKLKGQRLAEFKNFINTCEQTFSMKYFNYHATQGMLFEKLALLWATWGAENLTNTETYNKNKV